MRFLNNSLAAQSKTETRFLDCLATSGYRVNRKVLFLFAIFHLLIIESSALGQGKVYFSNLGGEVIDGMVFVPGGLASGTNYLVQLYAGKLGTREEDLLPVGYVAHFRTGVTAGYIDCSAGCLAEIPGVKAGEYATAQLRAWSAIGGGSFEVALLAAQSNARIFIGKSNVVKVWAGDEGGLSGSLGVAPFDLNSVPLALSITSAADGVQLSWPGYATNFVLEAQSKIGSPNWAEVQASPALINGRFTVTVSVAGESQFYRLRQR